MIARALKALLRFYQKHISPGMPRRCKYYPTCSAYAYGAIEKHGAFFGILLAVWRVLRCNPFSRGGYDPVPEVLFGKGPPQSDDDDDGLDDLDDDIE